MPSRNRKKRCKQRAEYLQKREDILSQENKAKARERYKADPEKKKASVRDTYKADPEKKGSVRDTYKADPEKKKASVRDTYKADPEKKKAYVRDTYNANAVSKRAAKRQPSSISPDGFDAVSVQNVGSTYIIVSWDLPTHSNGILINFSLYCNGALAGVLPLTVISYDTTGLLPFTLYMYMSSSHAHRHCTPHEEDSPPGGPPDPESDTNDIVISLFINKIINLTSPLAPPLTPCASFYNSPLC
ncbi:hypothetical protein EMCRGX_G002178 [Ephydatia muelleri]